MKLAIAVASMVAVLSVARQAGAEARLTIANDAGTVAGEFRATGGLTLQFDARVGADGSLDVLVTHDFVEIVASVSQGSLQTTSLAGVELEDALRNPELGRRVRQVIESPLWAAYRELVVELQQRIGADQSSMMRLLASAVESGDRFLPNVQRAASLARIPTK